MRILQSMFLVIYYILPLLHVIFPLIKYFIYLGKALLSLPFTYRLFADDTKLGEAVDSLEGREAFAEMS